MRHPPTLAPRVRAEVISLVESTIKAGVKFGETIHGALVQFVLDTAKKSGATTVDELVAYMRKDWEQQTNWRKQVEESHSVERRIAALGNRNRNVVLPQ